MREFIVDGGSLVFPDLDVHTGRSLDPGAEARDQTGQLWVKRDFDEPWQRSRAVSSGKELDATFVPRQSSGPG